MPDACLGGLDRPWVDVLLEFGFVRLADRDDEIVFGAGGKFWRLREQTVPLADPRALTRFNEPGFAKGAMNFRIIKECGATRLTTETKVLATDTKARRSFRPCWIPVRVVGDLLRLEMLRAVARHFTCSPENDLGLEH